MPPNPKAKLKALLKLPKERPSAISACLSTLAGTSLSWGVEVFEDDKLKEQAIQEATNTGLLTALLLTITANPLLADPPNFLGDNQTRINAYYILWLVSTFFFAAATILAVMQNVMFASLDGSDIRYFHNEVGILMHAPLLLFVCGALVLLAAAGFNIYFVAELPAFLTAFCLGGLLFLLLLMLITKFSLISFDCFDRMRKDQEAAANSSENVQVGGDESRGALDNVQR
mmetsp:Transcript_14559/g.29106  ORF Transcript_14559/g.29106 Transcript_14559/m.29106 type:complete len:229 (-) Transcript_14559:428-1114(-)|eukprot:CAMPEP_0181290394 /NCGR_PEP_ID=MMETSP1101-20121128/1389_1 /TAXON_ID=46948 /ORGANISM="Rhodomonas abbreviata, Strain Caron Lab Isolate" /LENGTH=228 /DNA_ID=CAMNT_0023394673 /DNA_START=95 /DNA_END=781 /DNA_ORIENTATION=+